ncbi:MAG: ABC transporter ATP-binding protein [Pseudomonadales bacterium]
MIIAKNITKYFGSFQALKDVSFDINHGEIIGFLGQNGAGKTTLMRILTSYLPASSGTVLIDGDDVSKNSLTIRQKIGYLPETPPLYTNMTVKDYLKFAAEIKGIPANQRQRQLNRVLEECQLGDVNHKTIATLSKGYKQRTGIAQAIIHEPKILILDEPTSGLDPIQNLQLRSLIKNLKDHRTVILSTHILSEIEQIAQRVLMIKAGKIIVDESLESLLNSHSKEQSRTVSLEEVFMYRHEEHCHDKQSTNKQAMNHYG